MTYSRRAAVVVVWAASLVGVGVWARAEVQEPRPPVRYPLPGSEVLAGEDLGFRVDGVRGDTRIGRLVVRVDGRWVDVQFAAGIAPATK
jgi:hypothetical protein